MTEHEKNPEEMPLYVCGFKNVQSGTKLNVYDGKACGWTDAGNVRDQTWFLQPAGNCYDRRSGPFLIISNLNRKHIVARTPQGKVDLTNGNKEDTDAWWILQEVAADTYIIYNVRYHENECVLDLAAGMSHDGNDIYSWPLHRGHNQIWQMIKH